MLLDIREIMATQLGVTVEEIPPDANLLELPGVDSLRLMQGLVAIEDHFGTHVDPLEAVYAATVTQVADLVKTGLSGSLPVPD
jgi:acyl carrier protein